MLANDPVQVCSTSAQLCMSNPHIMCPTLPMPLHNTLAFVFSSSCPLPSIFTLFPHSELPFRPKSQIATFQQVRPTKFVKTE